MIKIKGAHERIVISDGKRFLVDGEWPQATAKDQLAANAWLRDAAPSSGLREWSDEHPDDWEGFKQRYYRELDANREAWRLIAEAIKDDNVTFIHATEAEKRYAIALREYIEQKITNAEIPPIRLVA